MKVFTFILFLFAFNAQADLPKVTTVDYVDIDRYLGKWYEIARFDHSFQKNCYATSATYTLRDNGEIDVLNTCRIGSPEGRIKNAKGRAWVVDKETNAKLKVQFFLRSIRIPFLAGNYWILDLDPDYQYALVGDDSRKYLWILSRTKTLDSDVLSQILSKAENLKFDTSKLLYMAH